MISTDVVPMSGHAHMPTRPAWAEYPHSHGCGGCGTPVPCVQVGGASGAGPETPHTYAGVSVGPVPGGAARPGLPNCAMQHWPVSASVFIGHIVWPHAQLAWALRQSRARGMSITGSNHRHRWRFRSRAGGTTTARTTTRGNPDLGVNQHGY